MPSSRTTTRVAALLAAAAAAVAVTLPTAAAAPAAAGRPRLGAAPPPAVSRQAAADNGDGLTLPLNLFTRSSTPLPPRIELPAGITPGGHAGSYAQGDTFFISDSVDGSVWAGRYSGGGGSLRQLPATVGTGRRLYGIDFTAQVDVLWAAGGSLNGSGVGYALDANTGETLATYVFAPGNGTSFVSDVSGYGKYRAVFSDAGVPAVYSVSHGASGWFPQLGPNGRLERTFMAMAAPAPSRGISYMGFGLSDPEIVEIVDAASGESYYTDPSRAAFSDRDAWTPRGLAGTPRALTGAAGMVGVAAPFGTLTVCRPAAGVITNLVEGGSADGSSATPKIRVMDVDTGAVTLDEPVAIAYAPRGFYVLNRRRVRGGGGGGGGGGGAPVPPTDGGDDAAPTVGDDGDGAAAPSGDREEAVGVPCEGGAAAEPSGDGWETAEPSGDGWETAEPSGDGWETAEPSGDGWETAEPSGDGEETAEPSGDGEETAEPSGDGEETAEPSGDGDEGDGAGPTGDGNGDFVWSLVHLP